MSQDSQETDVPVEASGTKTNQGTNTLIQNGQEYQLQKIYNNTKITLIIGAILLAVSILVNFLYSSMMSKQLEITMALNQYRLGSKALTSDVQSYAVTGQKKYYDAYMKELNEDKNRDKATAILKKNGITDEEWKKLNEISSLSDGLVPLEEEAMEKAGGGDTESAMQAVFGDHYEQTIDQINALTDEAITQIQERESKKGTIFKFIQLVSQFMFLASFLYVIRQIMQTVHFARKELLVPILKASEQMTYLAHGQFHTNIDLAEDDTEVGRMVGSMQFMKKNLIGMIHEISSILEQMSSGNYQITIEQEYVGEFVQIKESLLKITQIMRETLNAILQASEQIDSGSGQLSYAAEDLAENGTLQASKISDLVDLVNQMTKDMERNAQSAEESVALSSKAGKTLSIGNAKM